MAGTDVVTDARGVTRCGWASSPARTTYHDLEWGTPTVDPAELLGALALTYFENGLSWDVVFGKRAAFRRAFLDFDPDLVAGLDPGDVDRLLRDPGIVRHRAKIEATIHNAGLIAADPVGFVDLLASHADSDRLTVVLRAHGFRLVGPVVTHSFRQAVGLENGHVDGCFRGRVCLVRPPGRDD